MKKKKKDRVFKDIFCFEFFCVLLFMVVTFVLVMKHELWFDEMQAWALADNLDVVELIKQMKYEGHSAMWSLFLKIFINMGFNYFILNFISWFIGCLSAILIMYKTKFNNIIKILLLFNISLVYYCTVFARPYSIIYLMFVLLIIFYKDRYKYPILVGLILLVLSNTHLMVMGFIAALFLIEFWEIFKNKQNIKEKVVLLVFMFIGVLLFFLQIVGALFARSAMFNELYFLELLYNLGESIVCFFDSLFCFKILKFLGFIIIVLICIRLFKYKKFFFILLSSILFYTLLSMIYYLNVFKGFYILLTLVFCISCILEYNDNKVLFLLTLFLLFSLPGSLYCIYQEYFKIVDDSERIVENIREENVDILTLSKSNYFPYECDKCSVIVDYFGGDQYYYNDFNQLGLIIFNSDKFYNYLMEHNFDYLVVPNLYYETLYEEFEALEKNHKNILKLIYKTNENECVSDKFVICHGFLLFKIVKS